MNFPLEEYLNNIVEQDHRFIKGPLRAMLGLKSLKSARETLSGLELVHMIRKGQVRPLIDGTPTEQFFALAS